MARPRKVIPASPFEDGATATPPPAPESSADLAVLDRPVITQEQRAARKPLTPEAQAAHARRMAEEQQDKAEDAAPGGTVQRIPFGTYRQRLHAEQRPGYRRRWFNDVGDRIARALEAGYVQVMDPRSKKPIQRTVGTTDDHNKMACFLMEIPEEFYNEDFAAKQESLNEVDKAIYSGSHDEEKGDKRYVPRSGINIRVERGMGR